MSSRRQWRPQFSPSEFRRGWVFFALYLVVFPVLMGQIQRMLSQRFEFFLQAPEFSLIYYFLLLCATVLLFWGFLRHSFDILLDWLPENLFAFAAGLFGAGALHFLAMRLPYPVENPNALLYPEQFADIDPVEKAGEIFTALLGTNPYEDLKEAGYEFRPIQLGE